MSRHTPPRLLEGLLEHALPSDLSGQGTLGDLAEEFQRRAQRSRVRARVWYAAQTASILRSSLLTRDGVDLIRRGDLVDGREQ